MRPLLLQAQLVAAATLTPLVAAAAATLMPLAIKVLIENPILK